MQYLRFCLDSWWRSSFNEVNYWGPKSWGIVPHTEWNSIATLNEVTPVRFLIGRLINFYVKCSKIVIFEPKCHKNGDFKVTFFFAFFASCEENFLCEESAKYNCRTKRGHSISAIIDWQIDHRRPVDMTWYYRCLKNNDFITMREAVQKTEKLDIVPWGT